MGILLYWADAACPCWMTIMQETEDNSTKKKVHVLDLQKGMYVAELDRPWVETPFMFQGFEINDQEQIDTLKKHCEYVYIDVEQGVDFMPKAHATASLNRARVLEERDKKISSEVRRLAEADVAKPSRRPYLDETTFEDELQTAKGIESEARDTMRAAVEDVEKGKKVDLEAANRAVTRMVESIVRNPDALVCLSHLKDVNEYTALHSIRSGIIALAFGRHLALSREELRVVGMGALLHDVGMAKLPHELLEKNSGLTVDEFQTMTQHVKWGLDIIADSGGLPAGAVEMIEQHHERSDGSGYPGHYRAQGISPAGSIAAIVDVYDAITSDRNYSGGLSPEDALKRMYEWRKKDFSAQMVEEFIKCMGIFPIGSLVELSTGAVGVVVTINRARRLKPKVALVLTANRSPFKHRFIADLSEERPGQEELKIKRVLPTGTYGINPMDHIVQL
jgi:HD-GYP domain-containing protein (c-di-GMP phosphodiesterase class II)